MNLQVLHQAITTQLECVRPAIDLVFAKTVAKIEKRGRAVNAKSFADRLNAVLKGTGIRVVLEQIDCFGRPEDTNGMFYPALGGYCFEPNEGQQARIHVCMCLHSGTNRLPLSDIGWKYFHYRFLKTTMHELVHRAQFANGWHRTNPLVFRPYASAAHDQRAYDDQTYLGDIDEIEAYARDTVEEWYYLYPNTPLTMRQIKKDFRDTLKLPALQYYAQVYKSDESHPSVQRLFRKIKQWNELITPVAYSLPPAPTIVKRDRQKYDKLLG